MRVLVAVASRYGGTRDIAVRIADVVTDRGHEVTCLDAAEVRDPATVAGSDAVVLGSAVYAGRWLRDALALVDRFGPQLRARPVWLFSSGPVGEPTPEQLVACVDVAQPVGRSGALSHEVFAGRVDPARMGFADTAAVLALRSPQGDFRDFDAVAAWAGEVADALEAAAVPLADGTGGARPALR